MTRKINIRPTTSVYATYKNIKYDPWTAIAEFVDNSTQSYYDNLKSLKETKYWKGLNVEIIYERNSIDGDKLIIRDNAFGMEFTDFQRAIILDSPPARASRSEFGMGLKTAACWFGVNWSVESTALGSTSKYKATVDVDALHKYRNEEIEVEEINCNIKEHGTTITIWNLNRTITGRQIGKTKDQLRGIYRTDFRTGEVKIYYNEELLRFEEPAALIETLPDGSTKTWRQEVDFDVKHGSKNLNVKGFIALRDTASTSDAGFSLIHRGRVIIGGYENNYRPEEVFEKSNSFVYQRLFGELNLDDWAVTQSKDAFDWYSGLEDEFVDKLVEICSEYKKKAKEYRKGIKTVFEPEVGKVVEPFSRAGIIGNVEIQPLDFQKSFSQTQILEDNDKQEQISIDFENLHSVGKKLIFDYHSKQYVFNLNLFRDDPQKYWLAITSIGIDTKEYDIEWNIVHPFFQLYINDPTFFSMMEQFIFAFALSEIVSKAASENGKISPSDIRLKMNEMLKKVMNEGAIK